MKHLKKYVSMLLVLTLLMSIQMPSFAASKPEVVLNELGLLLNISEGELDAVLTRDVGITMILKALGYSQADADKAALTTPFEDVEGWAKGWAALAYDKGITTGVGDDMFNPTGTLTEKQFVAFMLRALEYDTSASWTYAVTLAKSAGLIGSGNELTDTAFTKREASDVMYSALTSELQKAKLPLVEKLVEDNIVSESKAQKYGLITEEFEVITVVGDNLKIVKVFLSSDIDEETLTGNVIELEKNGKDMSYDDKVSNGVTALKYGLELEDSKTINIILGTPCLQSDKVEVSIDGLVGVNGIEVNDYVKIVKVKDVTDPEVVSVEGVNQKILEVTFSEPVQFKVGSKLYSNILIDDDKVAATATMSGNQKTVTFELVKSLEEGTRSIEIDSVSDYAGFSTNDYSGAFVVEADDEAPYVTDAYAPNRNELVVVFNEAIKDDEGDISYDGKKYDIDDSSDVTVESNVVTIELDSPLSSSAAVSSEDAEYDDIEDLIGNKVSKSVEFSFKAERDTIQPEMEAEVDEDNAIIVTFTEKVDNFNTNYMVLKDEDDDLVSIGSLSEYGDSGVEYKITLSNPLIDEATLTLSVMGIRDMSVFQNRMEDVDIDLDFEDKKRPSVEAVKLLGDDTIRVIYTEPMDDDMIGDGDNYIFYDKSKDLTTEVSDIDDYDIDVASDLESVDIYIPNVQSTDKLIVMKVEDEAGTLITNFGNKLNIEKAADFNMTDVDAKLIDTRTIKLMADDHEFQVIDADDFMIRTLSGDSSYHYITSATIDEDDASIAYLRINDDLDTDGTYKGKTQYIYTDDNVDTQDTYGMELEIDESSPLIIQDDVSPTLEVDLGTEDTLILEFGEVVSASSDSQVLNDILLRDSDGDFVPLEFGDNLSYSGGNSTNNFFDKLTVTGLDGGEDYTLEVVSRYIKDENGNSVEKFETTKITIKD